MSNVKMTSILIDYDCETGKGKGKERKKKLIILFSDVYQNSAKLSIGFSFPLLNSNQNCVTSFHVRFVKFEMIHPRSFVFANHHVMQKCMQTCVLKSISCN